MAIVIPPRVRFRVLGGGLLAGRFDMGEKIEPSRAPIRRSAGGKGDGCGLRQHNRLVKPVLRLGFGSDIMMYILGSDREQEAKETSVCITM